MRNYRLIAEQWMNNEDRLCHEDRVARLEWLARRMPEADYLAFHGLMTKFLFEEARYCFAYGQFLATIVLGLAYVEHSLAAMLYTTGLDEAERARAIDLFQVALDRGSIKEDEFDSLDRARRLRNAVVHFRSPLDPESVECRALIEHERPYSVLECDAKHVLEVAFHMMRRLQ